MAARIFARTPSWFRSIAGVPRQQPQGSSQSIAAATRQQETGAQAPPVAAGPLPSVSPRLPPQYSPSAAALRPPAPPQVLAAAGAVTAPPSSTASPFLYGQPRVPEAPTRLHYIGTITNQPPPVPLGQSVAPTQQRFFRSSLWMPPEPQMEVCPIPLLPGEGTLVVVGGTLLKTSDGEPAERSGMEPWLCQVVIFFLLTAAAVFILCLVLFQLSSEESTEDKTSQSPEGKDDNLWLEGLPGVRERGAITRFETTDGVTAVPGLFDDVALTASGMDANTDVAGSRNITDSRRKM